MLLKRRIKCKICGVAEPYVHLEVASPYTKKIRERLHLSETECWWMCAVCYSNFTKIAEKEGIKYGKLEGEEIPVVWSFRPYLDLLRDYGLRGVLRILWERICHGVSWYEANGIDLWILPEIAREDLHAYHLYSNCCVHETFLIRNIKAIEEVQKELIDYLRYDFAFSHKFDKYVPKLRYIFRNYKDLFKIRHPFAMATRPDVWNEVVDYVADLFLNHDYMSNNIRAELAKYFWPNIFQFWW